MSIKVVSTILCDDIRTEINGKAILIGVINGSLNAVSYPFLLKFCLWIEFESEKSETQSIQIRIESPSGNPPGEIKFDLEFLQNGTSLFASPPVGIMIEKDGEIVISINTDGKKWEVIKRHKVFRDTHQKFSSAV